MPRQVAAVIEATRPVNSAMVALAVVVALGMASQWRFTGFSAVEMIYLLIASYSASAIAMLVNDIVDVDIDRINAPDRPIPSGRLSIKTAAAAALTFYALGMIAAYMVDLTTLAFYLLVTAGATLYNTFLKKTGLPGNLLVASLVATPFIYSWVEANPDTPAVLYLGALVFLSILAREIVKGIPDIEGDRRAGVKTIAVILGPRAASLTSAILYLTALVLSVIPAVKGYVNPYIQVPLIGVLGVLLVKDVARLLRNPTRDEALRHKSAVLKYMLIALIAFGLGTL